MEVSLIQTCNKLTYMMPFSTKNQLAASQLGVLHVGISGLILYVVYHDIAQDHANPERKKVASHEQTSTRRKKKLLVSNL